MFEENHKDEWIAGLVFKFRSSETVSYNAITI